MKFLHHFIADISAVFKKESTDRNTTNIKGITIQNLWSVHEKKTHLLINDHPVSFFTLLFKEQSKNCLQYLFSEFERCTLSITINKIQQDLFYNKSKERIISLYERKLNDDSHGKIPDIRLNNAIDEQIQQLQSATFNTPHFFLQGTLVMKQKNDNKKLKLFASIFSISILPNIFEQLKAFKHIFFSLSSKTQQHETVTSLHAIDPFIYNWHQEIRGIFLGKELVTNIPIFQDFFQAENFNSIILAKSGAGKTYLAQMLIKRLLFSGIRIIILDPENEYISFCERLHGQNLTSESLSSIDSFMYKKNQLSYLQNMIPFIFPDKIDQEVLVQTCEKVTTYSEFFLEIDKLDKKYNDKILLYFKSNTSSFCEESLLINFPIQTDNNSLSLYKIIAYSLEATVKTVLFIDEAHKVLDDMQIAHIIRQAVKRGRKHKLGICLISQDIVDFVQNKWSKAIISNATYTFLLKQEPVNMPLINTIFSLTEQDNFLQNAPIGDGLFIYQRTARRIRFESL